jgi:hypothetical protein
MWTKRKMKVNRYELFAVFAADDEYAPMVVVPARDADHAIERAQVVRAAFPSMRLGPPSRSCLVDPARDLGWSGIGVMSETVLTAIEKDWARGAQSSSRVSSRRHASGRR